MNNNFTTLAKYGTTGVAIALIGALVFVIWLFSGFLDNQNTRLINSLDKNTEVLNMMVEEFVDLEKMVTELTIYLKLKNDL